MMELENLKSNWNKVGAGKKSQNELLTMTKIKNHPKIKQICIKFFIETISIIVFLALYYDGFDGNGKPLWVNILLISSTLAYILNRLIGLFVLRNPIKENNLKQSLKSFSINLWRIAFFTFITTILFGMSIILFFTVTIDFTESKYFMLAGIIVSLVILVLLSVRNWMIKVKSIEKALKELDEF